MCICINKDNDSVELLAIRIMIELLNKVPKHERYDKIKSWFGNQVSQIEVIGTKIKFNVDKEKQEHLRENFMIHLLQAYEDLK